MKEAGVAGPQLPDQVVHCAFKAGGVFGFKNDFPIRLNERRPVLAVEARIEILFLNGSAGLVEYGFAISF